MAAQLTFKDSVFNAIDINEVIWIDDRFAEQALKLEDDYLEEIATLYETEKEKLSEFPPFAQLDWELPLEVVREVLSKSTEVISDFYRYLGREIPDLSTDQFNELACLLEDASGSKISHLSNAEWEQQKDAILENLSIKLFLIDLNFDKEGLSEEHGKTIICELLNRNIENCYLVLFTSETNFGHEEESKRAIVIDELNDGVKHHHFSVLSKKIVENESGNVTLEFKSAEFLKRIFLRKLSSEMVDTVKDTISTSLDALKDELSQNSIYEVDTAIFNKSLAEGLSEFDLLHRLFSIKQKEVMHKNLTDNPELIDKLKIFRSVQGPIICENEKAYIENSMMTSSHFISLRHNEMFDLSINIIHSPLSCGDVFNFTLGDVVKQYILIDQPCDLSVRGDSGERIAKEVLLVPFEVKKRSPAEFRKDQNLDKHYMMRKASDSAKKEYYRFDFSGAINVNSHLLDLAVFNTKGELNFTVGQADDELLFLPGWIKRFATFKESVVDGEVLKENLPVKYKIFTMFEDEKFPVTVTDKTIAMIGKRVKQLRTPFIEELMSSYYVDYKARTAFEMDFS
jgi:hypothetical protein